MLNLPLQYFGHLMQRLMGKDPDAGKDWGQEEKGATEDEVVRRHHWLSGHEFQQASGVGDGEKSGMLQSMGLQRGQTWLSDWTATMCYLPNFCGLKFLCWRPNTNELLLGGRGFESWLDEVVRVVPHHGISALVTRGTKKPLDESERGEWKSWLKAQHSENEDHGTWSHHFMGNRWGNSGNSVRLYFRGLQNHSRLWLQPWN